MAGLARVVMLGKGEAANLLLRLVKIYTPSGEERRLHSTMREIARELGYEEAYGDEVGNFLMSYGEGAPVLLAGHLDTVPGELEAGFDGEAVYGRGAVDAKGPLAAMLLGAAEARKGVKGLRVYVAGLAREETDSRGAQYLVERGFKADHVLVGEPTGLGIAIAYRGSLTMEAHAEARGGHSSAPYVGESALDKLLGFIGEVREAFGGASYGEPTSAVTVMKAGEWPGSLPEKAYAVVSVRFPVPYRSERILTRVQGAARRHGVELRVVDRTEPVEVKLSALMVRALMRGIIRLGGKPRLVKKTGTSDMNTLSAMTSSIAAFGPGDSKLAHTRRERLPIDQLIKAANIITEALKELSIRVSKV